MGVEKHLDSTARISSKECSGTSGAMEHWGKIRAEVCLVFVVRRLDDISKSSLSKIRNHGCRLRGWVSGTVMNSVKIDSIWGHRVGGIRKKNETLV